MESLVPLVEVEVAFDGAFHVIGEGAEKVMPSDALHIVDRVGMTGYATSTLVVLIYKAYGAIAAWVKHNLEETEGVLMSNEAVTELIFEKLPLTGKVIGDYSNAAFFTRENKAPGK